MDNIYFELLKVNNQDISNRQHVQSILKKQTDLKAGICPRRGGKLIGRTDKYGLFYGRENYVTLFVYYF